MLLRCRLLLSTCVLLLWLTCIHSQFMKNVIQAPTGMIQDGINKVTGSIPGVEKLQAGINAVTGSIPNVEKLLTCSVSQITSVFDITFDAFLRDSLSRSPFKELAQNVCPASDIPTALEKTIQYLDNKPVEPLQNGTSGTGGSRTKFVKYKHPMDCAQVLENGNGESGVYSVWVKSGAKKPVDAYCDMDTDGGGWTVIQRRAKFCEQEDFNRNWKEYKNGFGDPMKEFWMGNDNIFAFTNQAPYSLRLDLETKDGDKGYGVYKTFSIEDETSNYKFHVGNFTGDIGDGMRTMNEWKFSTKDRGNDGNSDIDGSRTSYPGNNYCTKVTRSGWWFLTPNCIQIDLNGLYRPGAKKEVACTKWELWKDGECLARAEMKLKRT